MGEEKFNLKKLKENYEILRKKHALLSFEEMNQEFFIEKLAESETDILIRELRKQVGDRLANYMRFMETLLNPVNVPMFVFSVVKTLSLEDKQKLSEMYNILAKKEIEFIKLDIKFSEEDEIKFLKESIEIWKLIQKDFSKIILNVESKFDDKAEVKTRDYFG